VCEQAFDSSVYRILGQGYLNFAQFLHEQSLPLSLLLALFLRPGPLLRIQNPEIPLLQNFRQTKLFRGTYWATCFDPDNVAYRT
jgi:hypothetical protein